MLKLKLSLFNYCGLVIFRFCNPIATQERMKSENNRNDNPLKMQQLEEGGLFVLPDQLCSSRRADFFRRGNIIIGFYTTVAMTSKHGHDLLTKHETEGKLKPDTQIKIDMNPDGGIILTNYGLFKKQYTVAGRHLTNQVFLMLYGNFEAYFSDLVLDALIQMGSISNPIKSTITIMTASKWRAKFDRINQKLGIGKQLGRAALISKFKDVEMGFLGDLCQDPVDFLEKMADFRHRLVHSSGRVDQDFKATYPKAGLSVGQILSLPFGLPIPLQLFYSHLTDIMDQAFAKKFGWNRKLLSIQQLT